MRQPGEPSVEEILDSIKKVIARDNRAAHAEPHPVRATPQPESPPAAQDDDVLDLAMSAQFLDFQPEDEAENAVEPALVQAATGSFVSSITVANEPEVQNVDTCVPAAVTYDPALAVPLISGLTGAVPLEAGYNTAINADPLTETLTLVAALGAGKSQQDGGLCNDIPRTPSISDSAPVACRCSDVISTINGQSAGPGGNMPLILGTGLTAVVTPGTLTVVIDPNIALAACT